MIKFGIIGCGRIGLRHAEHISKLGKLVSVCDIIQSKAQLLAEKHNSKYFTDANKLLLESDIDVVAICSPNGLHYEHTILSLNSQRHVICEKPMALKKNHCAEMINCAEKNNCRLFVVKQNRFNPPVVKVKELIETKKLGKIFNIHMNCFWNRNEDYYRNSWKGSLEMDGGTLYTQFSHFIDLLYYLFGDFKISYGFRKNYTHSEIIDFEDSGVCVLDFDSGAIGSLNYTVSSFNKNMEGSITLFGEKGTVKIGGQYLNELEYQEINNLEKIIVPNSKKPNNYGSYKGSMSNHDLVYQNVIDVLCNNKPIMTSSYEGLKTVEIIEDFYKNFPIKN